MYAWLVVNGFLQTAKYSEINSWLLQAADKMNISIRLYKNTELIFPEKCVAEDKPDFVIFWDKDIRLAKRLEDCGLKLFNRASAIEKCDDKALTYMELCKTGILMPETIIAPMAFSGIGYADLSFMEMVENRLGYPMVVKEAFGSFGAQVYLCNSREEVNNVLSGVNGRPVIFQEYISDSTGRDIRINIVGGKAVATMLRYNPNDFRANISNGGSMSSYTPTPEQITMAVKACQYLKLDFAGVDILFGKNDTPVLCEVNSNAHFKSIYQCTGINVAEEIINHIKQSLG